MLTTFVLTVVDLESVNSLYESKKRFAGLNLAIYGKLFVY